MLELYHWEPNGAFLKPLVALHEKGIEFTSRYFDPTAFAQFAPGFPGNVESGLNLEREGPILVHEGAVISGSFFMLEYIAETFPGVDLYPGGAYERYRARAWGQFLVQLGAGVSILGCAKYLAPVLKQRDQNELRAQLAHIQPQERREAWSAVIDGSWDDAYLAIVRRRLEFPVRRIEDALARSTWLAGPGYSVADIDAFAYLTTLPDLAPDVVNDKATPRIMEFLERMQARPAVKAALASSRTGRPHEAFVPGAESSRWG